MGGKIFKSIFIILVLFFAWQVFGYDNLKTHPLLSGSAAEIYNQGASLKLTDLQKSWIIKGSIGEDTDPRYINHFYDPVTGSGLNGYDQEGNLIFKVQGQSARAWAKDQNRAATGDYSESAILKNYQDGNLTRAYQGIGHIIHLIQDMSVPAHTRNDPHAGGDPYENWAKIYGTINPAKLPFLSVNNLDQTFDQMANYSNNNFFSKDTINTSNIKSYKTESLVNDNKKKIYFLNNINGVNYKLCYTVGANWILSKCYIDDDSKVHQDYWSMLYPKAVGYSAGVIDYFVKQFEQIDKSKKEQEKISALSKLKNFFAWLKNEVKYTWGDVVLSQRNVLASGYDKVTAAVTNTQDNFQNFSDASREMAEGAASRAGQVLSAFEQAACMENTAAPEVKNSEANQVPNVQPDDNSVNTAPPPEPAPEPPVEQIFLPLPEEQNGANQAPESQSAAAQSAPTSIFVAGDSLPPETTITSGPSQITNLNSATFIFTSSESNSTFDCNLNDNGWEICVTPRNLINLPDRGHIFKVRARDVSNNIDQTPAEHSWTLDTISPRVIITNNPADFASSTDANFTFDSNESNPNFTCDLDTVGWEICVSPKGYSSLVEGAHNFKIKSDDQVGNISTTTEFSWMIDLTEPQITVVSGPPDIASSTTANFQFDSSEDYISYVCRLDTNSWQTCSASTTAADLIEGEHSLEIKGTDQAGNTGSSTLATWRVDLTAPTSTVASLEASYEATGFTVNWSGEDADAIGATTTASGLADFDAQYKIGVSDWQDWVNATTSTSTIFNLAVDSGQTIYFRALARDLAGNLGAWSEPVQTTISDNSADHIVVSEVQVGGATADDEFIELYNPTGLDINLSGYSIQYHGPNANSFEKKNFLSDSIIKAKGYFLITSSEYTGSISADFNVGFHSAASGGTIFLANTHDELTDNTATSTTVIDRLAYGSGSYLFPEGTVYPAAPATSQSLERKANATSTADSMAIGAEKLSGNSYDSDNNSNDFVLRTSPAPQNSISSGEPSSSDSQNKITAGNTSTGFSNWKSNFSWKHTASGNDRVLVVGLHGNGDYLNNNSVTFGGQTMVLAAKKVYAQAYNNIAVFVYYLANPPQGEYNIMVNILGALPFAGSAITFNNCDTVDPVGLAEIFLDTTSPITHSVTTTKANIMLVDAVTFNQSESFTLIPEQSQTGYFIQHHNPEWYGRTNNLYAGESYKLTETAGSKTISWTASGGGHTSVHVIIGLNPKP